MNMIKLPVEVKLLTKTAHLPKYESEEAIGFDIAADEEYILEGKTNGMVSTGLSFAVPTGYEIQIRPRSGMSAKTKLRISNSPGTVDPDYRGEVKILVDNIGKETITINKGDRIAQGVLSEKPKAEFKVVDKLNETERGENGIGSTGTNISENK